VEKNIKHRGTEAQRTKQNKKIKRKGQRNKTTTKLNKETQRKQQKRTG